MNMKGYGDAEAPFNDDGPPVAGLSREYRVDWVGTFGE